MHYLPANEVEEEANQRGDDRRWKQEAADHADPGNQRSLIGPKTLDEEREGDDGDKEACT